MKQETERLNKRMKESRKADFFDFLQFGKPTFFIIVKSTACLYSHISLSPEQIPLKNNSFFFNMIDALKNRQMSGVTASTKGTMEYPDVRFTCYVTCGLSHCTRRRESIFVLFLCR